jgi:glycosyltransferase involved in cell wall biosynthesis
MDCPVLPLTLLHVFSSFKVGGAQVRFSALANHFGGRYRHLIMTMDGATECAERLNPSVDYQMVSMSVPKNSTLTNFFTLRRRLASLRPDLLVTYNWGTTEWALANTPPRIRHLHVEDGFGLDEAERQLRRRVLFRRVVLSLGSTVVLPSRTLWRIAAEQWHLNPQRLRYIPNGIDCQRFSHAADSAMTGLRRNPGELLVGTVAALRPEKNLHRLIAAFARLRPDVNARLVVVGGGPERTALEQTVRQHNLGDAVLFTGPLAAPERVLAKLDLFALSSDTEQMPVSILEAMASGLAIATVDVGDVREMLSPANRPYVVPRDELALAGIVRTLLVDGAARRRIGNANRAHVAAAYDQARMFADWGRLFDGAPLA